MYPWEWHLAPKSLLLVQRRTGTRAPDMARDPAVSRKSCGGGTAAASVNGARSTPCDTSPGGPSHLADRPHVGIEVRPVDEEYEARRRPQQLSEARPELGVPGPSYERDFPSLPVRAGHPPVPPNVGLEGHHRLPRLPVDEEVEERRLARARRTHDKHHVSAVTVRRTRVRARVPLGAFCTPRYGRHPPLLATPGGDEGRCP